MKNHQKRYTESKKKKNEEKEGRERDTRMKEAKKAAPFLLEEKKLDISHVGSVNL